MKIDDEGMVVLEDGIVRARSILSGYPINALFNASDFMNIYNCVYTTCLLRETPDTPFRLYSRFKTALEQSIHLVVLPTLANKHHDDHDDDASFLIEALQMWEHYKTMSKCLLGFFSYLDSHYTAHHKITPLHVLSDHCFCDLVFDPFFPKLRHSAISLIHKDRAGDSVDCNLLKKVFNFFVEIGQKRSIYYQNFEQALIEDAATYYSRLASEWLLRHSFADYMLKVDLCMDMEKTRLGQYLCQSTMNKLLQAVQWQLISQTKSELMQKQKAENHDPSEFEALLSKWSSMSLEEHVAAAGMHQN